MKKQLCKNCTFYTAYYKQLSDNYGKLNNGFCSKHEIPKTQFEICECFKSNEQKEESRQKRMLNSLERALTSINEIAQIMKEKENDK